MKSRREFLELSLKAGACVGTCLGYMGAAATVANAVLNTSFAKKSMSGMELNSLSSTHTLNNGVKIPVMGFGTSRVKGDKGVAAITEALKFGYRLIDTAQMYDTEKEIAAAIQNSGVKREDLFITSKLDNYQGTFDETLNSFNQSLENLKTNYLDLYLIHFPEPDKFKDKWLQRNTEVWTAMEKLYRDKKVRSIGVSNFYPKHLHAFLPTCKIKPTINQIEIHPFYIDDELISLCRKNDMLLEAYSPLARGGDAFNNETLVAMAKKYNKSVSQIMIRWSMQMGFIPIPRSMNADRIRENGSVFDFSISGTDIKEIAMLKTNNRKLIPVQK